MLKVKPPRNPNFPFSQCPQRSPKIVSEVIAPLIKNKTVCELGCAEGDNLVFMEQYANKVFGIDNEIHRLEIAIHRGLNASYGDYYENPIPEADVYYFWTNDYKDNPFLVNKIIGSGWGEYVIVAGDSNLSQETLSLKKLSKLGHLVEIPFNEGPKQRQSGIFLLLIIKLKRTPK
jgi:hypothetical protein